MATATGKTVLGLAAIAVQYGRLHPLDEDIDRQRQRRTNRKAKVLIVAHNDLILEQWRREFDRHMNIPQDRTQGRDDVELTWGRIHFRTAQSLLNRDHIEYNLVVLDEAHHYANGSGWGKLLDSFENNVLALSGSVDEGGEVDSKLRDRLESTVGPEIKRYNITDAQHDGVIPTFDWRVEYVPTGKTDSEFVEITEKAAVRFDKFRERIETGELTLETDRRLRTHDDIRRFAHTTEGKQLKRDDEGFKEFATTVFSRQTQRWNQSPQLDAVVDTVQRYADNKVVVLTNNNTQIDRIAELLASSDGVPAERIYTVYGEDSSTEQRDTVDSFDEPGRPSVLIGTGDLIGEGVDMQHADVGINMSTGSVNKELIQRIGRVLRNPDGDKQAIFVNLVGIPVKREAQIPEEDGQNLIEDAQQFVAFGERFDNEPTFATASSGISEAIGRLLAAGREQIITLDADGVYDWPDDNDQREQLEGILSDIDSELPSGTDAVLKAWSTVTTDLDDTGPPPEQSGSVDQASPETADSAGQPESTEQTDQSGGVALAVHNRDGDPISDAFVSIVNGDDTTCGRTDKMGQLQVDASFISGTVAVRHPSAGVTTTSLDSPADASRQTITLSETKPHS
jgi:superfamily II DNA or RNA helicase